MKKLFFALMVVAGTLLSMSGCNTVEGVGKDVEKVGDTVKDAAN